MSDALGLALAAPSRVRTRMLVLAGAALVLTGCGGAGSAEDGGTTSDPAGSWVLAEAEPPIEVPDDARMTLEVAEGDRERQLGGTAACNSYGANAVVDGDAWRTEGYEATAMGCDEPRMTAEEDYRDALERVTSWRRPGDDELVLGGDGLELRFEALAPVPTAELVGTTWALAGLTSGTGPELSVSSPAQATQDATLHLGEDGTMRASTGCRTFSGTWTEQGDEILLPELGVDDDSPNVTADGAPDCDDAVVEQERHVLSVLGDGFRAQIDEQRLRLTSRDGRGLVYRADP